VGVGQIELRGCTGAVVLRHMLHSFIPLRIQSYLRVQERWPSCTRGAPCTLGGPEGSSSFLMMHCVPDSWVSCPSKRAPTDEGLAMAPEAGACGVEEVSRPQAKKPAWRG
jgi:hypothetical protein